MDDGSSDDTAGIAAKCGADVIHQKNQGPGAACNNGLTRVTAPVVAYLDSDDLWLPDKMERQLAALEEDPSLAAVYGRTRLFRHGTPPDSGGTVRDNWGRTAMAARTASKRAIGPFYDPPDIGIGDTVDWVARAREGGYRLLMMPEIVAYRRVIPGSLSYGYNRRDLGYLDVARRSLERRRGRHTAELHAK